MERHPSGLRMATCSFCGKEVQLPDVMGDGDVVDVVEDGKIIRSRLKDGKLVRDPEPIPAYHVDCFHAAFGQGRKDEP